MENSFYADGFAASYTDETGFLQSLREIEEMGSWKRVDSNEIKLAPLLEESRTADDLRTAGVEEEIIADTIQNSSLALLVDGETYPVRDCAVRTIYDRARISGNALKKVKKPVLAEFLCECFKVTKGKALIRTSAGKLSALHGGDESEYAALSIPELLRSVINYLAKNFHDCTFKEGRCDHSMTTAYWDLGNEEELVEAYLDALARNGLPARKEGIRPALVFSSSDVGLCGANLRPSLQMDGTGTLPLGKSVKLEHKNGASLEDFRENLEKLYSLYMEAVRDYSKLLDIEIQHPINCMLGVMKKLGFGKKLAFETMEGFRLRHGSSPCSAEEVYRGIYGAVNLIRAQDAGASRLMQMEETVSRALACRWQEYDIPGEPAW